VAHAVLVFDSIYVSQDWAEDLEENIQHVLDVLMDQLDREPEEGDEPFMETPSGEPFDGCETCVRRETMVLTLMATIDAVSEGLVERRLVA